jgi:UDP-3-O-[3-hydroxymyristoyl] glucosamine N-acyltransferase
VYSSAGITLEDLAQEIGAELKGDNKKIVFGLNSIEKANKDEVSFISRDIFLPFLTKTSAAAVILSEDNLGNYNGNALLGKNPHLLYAKASKVFMTLRNPRAVPFTSKQACIHDSANIGDDSTINSFVTVSEGVVLGGLVSLGSSSFLGKDVRIGTGTIIYSNVSIYEGVEIGSNCIIHSGTVIGSDGLGFAKDGQDWHKIEHLGRVIIGNNVEIGSNSSIDKGSVGNTKINDNVKIDNQVHLAHNVEIGEGTAIAARSAIAGSSKIGRYCTLAGCCAVVDNVEISDDVHVTAMTLITKSIKEPGTYSSGTPFMKNKEWKKNAVLFKKLNKLIK